MRLQILKQRFIGDHRFRGTILESREILPASLSDTAIEFVHACYEEGFVQGFDWMSWSNTKPEVLEPDASFDDIDLSTVIRLLTLHLRADRFNDGHLMAVLQQGIIAGILRQLARLGEQPGLPKHGIH